MNMKLFVAAATIAAAVACGNPVSLEKDLRRSEKKNEDLTEENKNLKEKNSDYAGHLQGIFTSENFLWFFAALDADFSTAVAACEEVGYALPGPAELAEFEEQVFNKNPEWKKPPGSGGEVSFTPADIHLTPEEAGSTRSVVLCRTARKEPRN